MKTKGWIAERLVEFEILLKESRRSVNAERTNLRLPPLPLEITVHKLATQNCHQGKELQDKERQEQNKTAEYKDHKWLETMDAFAKGVYGLAPEKYLDVPTLEQELKQDIHICLIDDGVEIDHKSITERME